MGYDVAGIKAAIKNNPLLFGRGGKSDSQITIPAKTFAKPKEGLQ